VSGAAPAVLAIDGGNSKSDLALVAGDGTPLATVRGPGMAGHLSLDEKLGVLGTLTARAQRQAGWPGSPVARHLSACVANADLPEEEEEMAGALRARGWTETSAVFNDTFAVLRAGLAPPGAAGPSPGSPDFAGPPGWDGPPGLRHWGVAVTCGAGINCVGVAPDGRTTGFLALGEISGDWGGGSGLGLAALWWAIRAEDGRGPETGLRSAVAAHFGVPSVQDVTIGLHLGTIAKEDLRGLAPVVLALGTRGDAVAAALVQRQAEEVCAMALAVMRRLSLTGLATPVVLGGGVLAGRDPVLTAAVIEGIKAEAPEAAVRVTDVPPVAGAALLGLDHLGAGTEAERRLRAAYAERTQS
jgi:N-acetylglucosamine kinase-like BadF-type ATPase